MTMVGFLGWLGPSLSVALPEPVGWEPPDLCSWVSPGKRVQTRKILIFQLLAPDVEFSPWLFTKHSVGWSQVHEHLGVPGVSQTFLLLLPWAVFTHRLWMSFLKAVASSPLPGTVTHAGGVS